MQVTGIINHCCTVCAVLMLRMTHCAWLTLQGQLWGVCDVQRASHKGPEVAMETDANVAVRSKKSGSAREPASVMAGNSFKHVHYS